MKGIVAFLLGVVASFLACYCFYRIFVVDKTAYLPWMSNLFSDSSEIPRTVMQTYHKLDLVPQKVQDQFEELAPGFARVLFDDTSAMEFMEKHYGPNMVLLFESFRVGAFKADLFRYCYLYVEGGIYMDIKTKLVKPIGEIYADLRNRECSLATCMTSRSFLAPHTWSGAGCAYQGIIFAKPRNPIFLECIEYMRQYSWRGSLDYLAFCKNFWERLRQRGVTGEGFHAPAGIVIWSEHLSILTYKCMNKRNKKIPLCSTIVDPESGSTLFISRFQDFPWRASG